MATDYDPSKVTLVVAGDIATGIADNIKFDWDDNEVHKMHKGMHGEVSRTRNPNRAAKITVTLKASSPKNKFYDLLAESDEDYPVMIVENFTNKLKAGGEDCFVFSRPNIELATEEGTREWVFGIREATAIHQ